MKHSKKIFGIVLLIIFSFLLSLSIINKAIKPLGVVLLIILLVSSIWLLASKKKAHSADDNRTKTKPVLKTVNAEKNAEKHKQDIEEYKKFIAQVYFCTSNSSFGNQLNYVCVHKETKELFCFSAKKVGRNGAFDEYCFVKQPQKISSYTQLLSCLDLTSKEFYSDLCEKNWNNYFDFMLLPPEHSGEVLRKQLLSRESKVVRKAVFAVHDLVLKNPEERKAFLSDAYLNLSLIKKNFSSLDMGGMFTSNNRFNHRAIQIIEGNNTDKCFCRLIIDEFGPSADGLAKNGFILLEPDKKINDYTFKGMIECPICHKKYTIIEEYTGWHIPTSITCIEVSK